MSQWDDLFDQTLSSYMQTEEYRGAIQDSEEKDPITHPKTYIDNQRGRWIETLEWLEGNLKGSVLELGGEGFFTFLIRRTFPDITLLNTRGRDLRNPLPYLDGSVDLILNMEVMEHIKDLEGSKPIDLVNLSGMRHVLVECHRVLRVGGKMFISTPNATGYMNLRLLLANKPPWVDYNHFKELTVPVLRGMLEESEFQVDRMETVFVFYPAVVDHIKELIATIDHEKNDRGDDIFAVVSRTA